MDKIKFYGSRAEVYHGKAKMTKGRLKKGDLVKNKIGRIVSKKKLSQSKNPKFNPLLRRGLQVKKGSKKFGVVKPSNNNKKSKNNKSKNNKSKNNTGKSKSSSLFNLFFD